MRGTLKNQIMKTKQLLLLTGLAISLGHGASAQIVNYNQPDLPIWGAPNNTGIAIAPNEDAHAIVADDGFGNYRIFWIESATSTMFDADGNSGNDPDVAYFRDADALVVAYEDGGAILVDEYKIVNPFPTADYALSSTTPVFSGQRPNVDVNSSGRGVLTWEDGGVVWACSFNMLPFTADPPVQIEQGSMPDIVLFDDNNTVAITYVDPNGSLMIFTLDYGSMTAGNKVLTGNQGYDWLGNTCAFPRIASQRNMNFGPWDDFTVVAQYTNSPITEVFGIFSTGGTISTSPVLVNSAFSSCFSSDPLPVVAYDRSEVHVAWSQDYSAFCSGLWETAPNNPDDVLLANFDFNGNLLFSSVPAFPVGTYLYEEVNRSQSNYASVSKTSISTEYDGSFNITNTNYHEGVAYNDPGDLFWKGRDAGTPFFSNQANPQANRDNNFSLITSPVDQTIEVLSESDDIATFEMLDNAGRIVALKTISNEGNVYNIDISHLSGGIYLLHCTSNSSEEVLRILQVTK